MASGYGLRVQPLKLKQDNERDCFDKFLMRFELAIVGSGIKFTSEKEDSDKSTSETSKAQLEEWRKGAALLNVIGEEGMKIFEEWDIELKDVAFTDIVARFKEHFSKKEGIILLRHRFLNTRQLEGETTTEFISRVGVAAAQCKLGSLKDDMIVQIVINGLRNEDLRCKLLTEEKVDLQSIRTKCEQVELAERTSKAIGCLEIGAVKIEDNKDSTVAAMHNSSFRGLARGRGQQQRWQSRSEDQRNYTGRPVECFRCKGKGHIASECRSKWIPRSSTQEKSREPNQKDIQCYNCKGYGHIASTCNSKPRRSLREDQRVREVGEGSGQESDHDYDYAGRILSQ